MLHFFELNNVEKQASIELLKLIGIQNYISCFVRIHYRTFSQLIQITVCTHITTIKPFYQKSKLVKDKNLRIKYTHINVYYIW